VKPLVRVASLILAVLFLMAAAFAWIEILQHGDVLSDPRLKSSSAWLMSGLMFLPLGVRGWRPRQRRNAETKTT
jgi:hypothetical protein